MSSSPIKSITSGMAAQYDRELAKEFKERRKNRKRGCLEIHNKRKEDIPLPKDWAV